MVGGLEDKNILIGLLVILLVGIVFLPKPRSRHKKNIDKSQLILKKLRSFEHDGAVINYLRKIDPFVFEEVLLTAFSDLKINIIRNMKYTGDGGIDGRIVFNGKIVLLQAKRYAGPVKTSDINELSDKCLEANTRGLFIHTGTTPKKSAPPANVTVVSGSKLVQLIKSDTAFNKTLSYLSTD